MIYPHHQKKVVAASPTPAKKQITIFLHQLLDNRLRLENEITDLKSKATETLKKTKNYTTTFSHSRKTKRT